MILNKSEERWKDIEGLEGLYAVSTKGRVKNLKTNKIFTGGYSSAGYKQVSLNSKTYTVHRLVALAFIPNPQKLPYINHIDEDKTNNNVENLAWCTPSENVKHSIYKQCCKVKQITKDGELVKTWDSCHQIERELGYNRSAIINVCKKKLRYAYNFRWEYMDPSSQLIYNRPIIVFKGNEFIGEFANAVKASQVLGLKYNSVSRCLQGRLASNKGYTFKYAE